MGMSSSVVCFMSSNVFATRTSANGGQSPRLLDVHASLAGRVSLTAREVGSSVASDPQRDAQTAERDHAKAAQQSGEPPSSAFLVRRVLAIP